MPEPPFHARSAAEVLAALEARATGLSDAEAAARLARHGPNALPEKPGPGPLRRFLRQFDSALIYFLVAASIAAALLDHRIDAAVILAAVLINAVIGFIQEGRAENALAAIRTMVAPRASLWRDGRRIGVAVADIVPGDIVALEPGDRVPADLRLLRARSLRIDEAMLTGESVAAEKHAGRVAAAAPLAERGSMAYSGTLVVAGQATGIAVATGRDTEIGRISGLIETAEAATTPLLRQIDRFATRFTWIALAASVALFLFATLVRGFPWDEALIAVVALAVGAIPEGLPAVITITLAIGVQRMARRKAVVRRLPAVETLGSTSVICTDKTGTLTRNEMTARRIVTLGGRLLATGAGYGAGGTLAAEDGIDDAGALESALPLIRCGVLCNDAELRSAGGRVLVEGDPMEGALLALAAKAGLDPAHLRTAWPRLEEIPFDARHRFMASLHTGPDGTRTLFVKGAPERLLDLCATEAGPEGPRPLEPGRWTEAIRAAASAGERVLGFASRPASPDETLDFAAVERGLAFLGLVGLVDPPREEAAAAIAECRSAGIAVKMITGDHAATAGAIARQLALADEGAVVTGAELDRTDDAALPALAARAAVFARTSPEHKLRLVRALQAGGAVVAMTGDGVNDAPALKQADIGIAMGDKGTEAAKEAAGMVLLDDNFVSIVAAVREGRVVNDNIRKVIAWTMPTNGGETLAVVAAIFLGLAMPMSAVQILWVNLVTEVTLGLVLAFEPAEPGVMQRRPRPADAPLLSRFLVWRIGFVSLLFAIGTFGIFAYALARGHDIETARTLVVDLVVVFEIFYLFAVRYTHTTSFTWRGALGTGPVLAALAAIVAAQLAFTYAPFMQAVFDTRPVSLADGLVVLAAGAGLMLILEAEKAVLRRTGWFGGPD
ncbi:HAD-IC family P-type ATPase [Prosthecomicrobium pneumaticum]|uniref:Magnesium-transporting ATPase (P-type) n=1 Tax=Prosthecomicrobium pneumaticum TaxID=81895 RepID=A0A7W9FLP7_9HYPH|nr:HAD-IC family P-type ATPase [Prosthecomicrobium pneumaticum]MBB5752970.1 magnesium-transporting ATPase (P-type) [Prosthecomicrobium pneumaticum]